MLTTTVFLKNVKWFDGAADSEHPAEASREFEIAENEESHTVNIEALLFDIEEWLRDNIDEWTWQSYDAEIETADGTHIPLCNKDGYPAKINIDHITGRKRYSILRWNDDQLNISFATDRADYMLSEAREALKEIALTCMVKYECAKTEEEASALYKKLRDETLEIDSVGITEDCVSFTTYFEDRYQIVETPLQP